MKPLTMEWVQKAEDDYIVAQKMLRARKHPVYDAVCFHAQQCTEKYLKAFLQEHGQVIPRTHKLLDLLKLCKEINPNLEILLPDLLEIERFSINIRYPGMNADKSEAEIAFKAAEAVRSFIQGLL